jgi:amidase
MTEGVMQEHCVSRTVRDSAALLDATAGRVMGALHMVPPPARPFLQEVGANPGKLRVGFSVASPLQGEVHKDCVDAVHDIAKLCESLGHEVTEANLTIDAEILKGATGSEVTNYIDRIARQTGNTPTEDQFEPMTWEWYQAGKNKTATDFIRHMANARQFQFQIEHFMSNYDVWLTPTITRPPVPLGWLDASADYDEYLYRMYDLVPFVFLCNISGLPGMTMPLVWNKEDLPIGTHFVGQFGDEATLFRLAAQLEEARPWVNRRPPVFAHP